MKADAVRRAGIQNAIHAVPNAHDTPLVGKAIIHVSIDLLEIADLLKHFDDTFIGAAM